MNKKAKKELKKVTKKFKTEKAEWKDSCNRYWDLVFDVLVEIYKFEKEEAEQRIKKTRKRLKGKSYEQMFYHEEELYTAMNMALGMYLIHWTNEDVEKVRDAYDVLRDRNTEKYFAEQKQRAAKKVKDRKNNTDRPFVIYSN